MWIDTAENRFMLAAAFAACAVVCVRRRVPPRIFAGALIVGVVAVAAATANVSRWGFHGQMHWAFSLATLRSSPPEDPVFAGQPLMYPWTAHWLYAHLGRSLGVTPMAVLIWSDALWLVVMILAVARAAVLLTGDKGAGVVAALLAWTGVLVTDDGYIAQMARLHDGIKPCMRMVPADKFFNPNNNPIGLALSAVVVLCIVRIVMRAERIWVWLGLLLGAAFGCAVLYPISYLGMVAVVGGGGLGVAIVRRKLIHTRMILCGAAVAIGGACALPWMLGFDAGRQEAAQITLTSAARIDDKLASLGAVSLLAAMLLAMSRRMRWGAADETANSREGRGLLIGGVIALAAGYIALAIPLGCEYKLLAQTAAPMACLLGGPIAALARRRWWLAGLILIPLSLGAADRELFRFYLEQPLPIRIDGRHARAVDPQRDEMLMFLRDRTPRNAVVLAEDALVPTVGERSLYLLPRSIGVVAGDGWSMGVYKVTLAVIGHSEEMLHQRERVQHAVVEGTDPVAMRDAAAALRREFAGRRVYTVVTNDATMKALRESGSWSSVFRWPQGEIFELAK